jgi:hypothetical protein
LVAANRRDDFFDLDRLAGGDHLEIALANLVGGGGRQQVVISQPRRALGPPQRPRRQWIAQRVAAVEVLDVHGHRGVHRHSAKQLFIVAQRLLGDDALSDVDRNAADQRRAAVGAGDRKLAHQRVMNPVVMVKRFNCLDARVVEQRLPVVVIELLGSLGRE